MSLPGRQRTVTTIPVDNTVTGQLLMAQLGHSPTHDPALH